mmetsp:Transcript_3158/g.7389  ORF Transcript_3158/g.7389 Transcript_3158/m.7389 type:complete len:247 (+) Transcript_3158:321-1061(+)
MIDLGSQMSSQLTGPHIVLRKSLWAVESMSSCFRNSDCVVLNCVRLVLALESKPPLARVDEPFVVARCFSSSAAVFVPITRVSFQSRGCVLSHFTRDGSSITSPVTLLILPPLPQACPGFSSESSFAAPGRSEEAAPPTVPSPGPAGTEEERLLAEISSFRKKIEVSFRFIAMTSWYRMFNRIRGAGRMYFLGRFDPQFFCHALLPERLRLRSFRVRLFDSCASASVWLFAIHNDSRDLMNGSSLR